MGVIFGMSLVFGAAMSSILVDAPSLAESKDVLIVDARDGASFEMGHIPGATNLSADSLSEERGGVVGLLKPIETLLPLFAQAGLDPKKTIIVYSEMRKSSDLKQATRLFWVLEYAGFSDVKLLDGGLSGWEASGRSLEKGPSTVLPSDVKILESLHLAGSRIASRHDVLAAQTSKKTIIADLRPVDDFSGTSKKDFIARAGHVSGAKSQPATSFVEGEHFTFKAPEVIREMLDASAAGTGTAVVTYCNTGRDATVGYAAYRIAGFEHVAVYDGSMAEWGNIAECPMSTGTEN